MSNYFGYSQEDNERRKANNLSDQIGWQTNNNVKCYSTKPGQLSLKGQNQVQLDKQKKLNKKQPVKKYTQEEIDKMNRERGMK